MKRRVCGQDRATALVGSLALHVAAFPATAAILALQCDVLPPDKFFDGKLNIDTTAKRARIGAGEPFEVIVSPDYVAGASHDEETLLFDMKAMQGTIDTMDGETIYANCKRM